MTDNDALLTRVERLVEKWKRILHLRDWSITWEIKRVPNNDVDALMSVLPDAGGQAAHISISPECGDLPQGNAIDDMMNLETLVVHELLHVVLEDVGVGSVLSRSRGPAERMTHRLARLFVGAQAPSVNNEEEQQWPTDLQPLSGTSKSPSMM